MNVKVTKSDMEVCHWMGDSRKTIVRFFSQKHWFDVLINKKMRMPAYLASGGLNVSTNLSVCQYKTCLITGVR